MYPKHSPKLASIATRAIIVKYKEDTTNLERALRTEGFEVVLQTATYTPEQEKYSRAIKCLITHSHAWESASQHDGLSIIVEADFVPTVGFGKLPLPYMPTKDQKEMAWLYSVGPVIYHIDPTNNATWGHNAGTVAYIVNSVSAKALLEVYAEDMKHEDPGAYRAWDTYYAIKLRREKGIRCHIPYKMYGEHGGISNAEHNGHKIVGWHEADNLAGPLHFLPTYAQGSQLRFRLRRLRGRLRGWYRFLLGKYFDGWIYGWLKSENHRLKRLSIALRRLI